MILIIIFKQQIDTDRYDYQKGLCTYKGFDVIIIWSSACSLEIYRLHQIQYKTDKIILGRTFSYTIDIAISAQVLTF